MAVNRSQAIEQNSINPSDASYKSAPTLLESLKRMAKTYLPGLNAYNFNSAKEDKNLSAIMTSIFAKTKINVYIYEFSEIAVFTIIGIANVESV